MTDPITTAHRDDADRLPAPAISRYSREDIVAAIQRWHELYGEPPKVVDWDPTWARRRDEAWRAERFEAGKWPTAPIVRARADRVREADQPVQAIQFKLADMETPVSPTPRSPRRRDTSTGCTRPRPRPAPTPSYEAATTRLLRVAEGRRRLRCVRWPHGRSVRASSERWAFLSGSASSEVSAPASSAADGGLII